MTRRLIAAALAALVTSMAAIGGAGPATAATTHHSVAAARQYIVGKWTSGPNFYTKWQRIQITGSHRDPCFNYYDIDDVMHQYANPTLVQQADRTADDISSPQPQVCPQVTYRSAMTGIAPNSWFNPFSWDWGHILSTVWNAIWNNCLSGATSGVVGTASGTTIINLLARGGKLYVGPSGYAAIAIGGCAVNLLW